MPQDRTLLAANARLRVERVHAHAGVPQWSAVYHAPSRRLVFPESGAVQFRSGDKSLLIDSLTAFCVGSAMAYQLKPEAESGARTSVVVSAASGSAPESASESASDRAVPPADAWLLAPAALYQLRLHWRSLEQGHATVQATTAVLAQTMRTALPACSTTAESHPVLRARRFLLAQPGAGHTLHEVADAAHSSAFHLARMFRRHTGLSLHQYRQRLRLAAALAMLEAGERDLAGLAHELGFCSQSHFGTVFRREIGVSPGEARAALRRFNPARI